MNRGRGESPDRGRRVTRLFSRAMSEGQSFDSDLESAGKISLGADGVRLTCPGFLEGGLM